MNTLKKIFKIKVERIVDKFPNTSWMGEFGNKAKSDYAINHRERGGANREFEWFNPPIENYKGESEADTRKYCERDYDRMLALSNGDFCFIGIKAEAEVGISLDGGKTYKLDTLTSGGVWGIESDSGESYLAGFEREELADLRQTLLAYGFGRSSIAKAIKNAERDN